MIPRRRAVDHRAGIHRTSGAIAISLTLILAFLCWALVFRAVPESNSDALLLLIGHLTALLGVVVSFYFGGSSEAEKQNDTIDALARVAEKAPEPPPP